MNEQRVGWKRGKFTIRLRFPDELVYNVYSVSITRIHTVRFKVRTFDRLFKASNRICSYKNIVY